MIMRSNITCFSAPVLQASFALAYFWRSESLKLERCVDGLTGLTARHNVVVVLHAGFRTRTRDGYLELWLLCAMATSQGPCCCMAAR